MDAVSDWPGPGRGAGIMIDLRQGDCLEVLKTLPSESVNCTVSSPPYFGLRSYIDDNSQDKAKEIGLEQNPEEYVQKMVDVFREVRRVLRGDGVIFLNLGDSYNGSGGAGGDYAHGGLKEGQPKYPGRKITGLKPKDLIGIPWRVAFALQADGWYLRQDIIWAKGCSGVYTGGSVMPESVTDRFCKAHEYLFLLTKSPRYFFDLEAVKEPVAIATKNRLSQNVLLQKGSARVPGKTNGNMKAVGNLISRNRRSVWTVNTQNYKGAHFATYPKKLIEPCILAGCPKDVCAECGAPWVRVVERINESNWEMRKEKGATGGSKEKGSTQQIGKGWSHDLPTREVKTLGFQPTCTCNAETTPGIVLDPFNGSGTTGSVALQFNRDYIGIELNPEYLELTKRRLWSVQPEMF
jgi:DNA modification methylase